MLAATGQAEPLRGGIQEVEDCASVVDGSVHRRSCLSLRVHVMVCEHA